jgi:hypothetical protein
VSKQVLEDARAAYQAWKEAPVGSYIEKVVADAILRDIVPSLILLVERGPQPFGFSEVVDVSGEHSIARDEED